MTDFLPAERARGITIQSAAITFHWPPDATEGQPSTTPTKGSRHVSHTINLIDTPGHADFTFEVIRSLRILDGAICILDGVAGVEAQTEKVWLQANNYRIPRILYVNKLDRDGAAFNRTIKEIASRLHTYPVLCQIPWWKDGKFVGVGDVISLQGLEWVEGGDGAMFTTSTLEQLQELDKPFAEELVKARTAMIEALTEEDDQMVECYLEADEDYLQISPEDIRRSLRRCLLSAKQAVTPVFAGASFRNIGVQPLLDAINDLLPSPHEAADPDISLEETSGTLADLLQGSIASLTGIDSQPKSKSKGATITPKPSGLAQKLSACALAFKVVNDPRRGVLVYVRCYKGSIPRNALLYNTNLAVSERTPRLLRMYASEAIEIESIDEGQIGVIPGLKHARTGDTLIVYQGASPKSGPPPPINRLQLRPIDVPPPLFFTSVEPNSLSEEKHLSESMALLLREDPSLHVSVHEESGQTHLAGMGELHLEIARDRLISDFKVKASMGAIEISYREAVAETSATIIETFDREIAGKPASATCEVTVEPYHTSASLPDEGKHTHVVRLPDSNLLSVHHPTLQRSGRPIKDSPALPVNMPLSSIISALSNGTSAALARGPIHGFPMHSTLINITFDPSAHLTPNSTAAALSSAARLAVKAALTSAASRAETVLMEPVMLATIAVTEDALGNVVHDLSSARGGQVLSLDAEEDDAESGEGELAAPGKDNRLSHEQLARVYAPPDPYGDADAGGQRIGGGQARQIRARVPLKEMVGYLKHLRSLTGGRGTFVMSVDRYERMNAQRQKAALADMRGAYV